jgi:hypothetical protein
MLSHGTAPCRGCPDRDELCHADCQKYAAYRELYEHEHGATAVIPSDNDHERKPSKFGRIARKLSGL